MSFSSTAAWYKLEGDNMKTQQQLLQLGVEGGKQPSIWASEGHLAPNRIKTWLLRESENKAGGNAEIG